MTDGITEDVYQTPLLGLGGSRAVVAGGVPAGRGRALRRGRTGVDAC